MKSKNHLIHVLFTLTNPGHSTSGDNAGGNSHYDPKKRRIVRFDPNAKYPVAETYKIPVATRACDKPPVDPDAETEPIGGFANRIAAFPANTIRNALRRAAATKILTPLGEQGTPVTLNTALCAIVGGATGRPETTISFSEIIEGLRHPFLGMIGGGPRLIPSGYKGGTAWPITPITLERGIVPDIFSEYATPEKQLTFVSAFAKTDPTKGRFDAKLLQVVENAEEAIIAYNEAGAENSRKRAEQRNSEEKIDEKVKKETLASFNFIEAVSPGVTFHVEHNVSDNERLAGKAGVGLYLYALQGFAREGRIGGLARHRYGTFNLKAFLQTETGLEPIFVDGTSYDFNSGNALATEAVAAFDVAAPSITKENLEKIFIIHGHAEAKDAAKAAKKAAKDAAKNGEAAA
jgi:CRISPR type IV-associated protein Csf2